MQVIVKLNTEESAIFLNLKKRMMAKTNAEAVRRAIFEAAEFFSAKNIPNGIKNETEFPHERTIKKSDVATETGLFTETFGNR